VDIPTDTPMDIPAIDAELAACEEAARDILAQIEQIRTRILPARHAAEIASGPQWIPDTSGYCYGYVLYGHEQNVCAPASWRLAGTQIRACKWCVTDCKKSRIARCCACARYKSIGGTSPHNTAGSK
jgi:hypothetical protein